VFVAEHDVVCNRGVGDDCGGGDNFPTGTGDSDIFFFDGCSSSTTRVLLKLLLLAAVASVMPSTTLSHPLPIRNYNHFQLSSTILLSSSVLLLLSIYC